MALVIISRSVLLAVVSKMLIRFCVSEVPSSSETQGLLARTMRYFRARDIFGRKFTSWNKLLPGNIASSRLAAD